MPGEHAYPQGYRGFKSPSLRNLICLSSQLRCIPINKELQNGLRIAGYVRVSQERAARNGYGLGAQEADIKKHIDYKDCELVEIYQDKGVPGYKKDRPALKRLLQDAQTARFDVVLFPGH